MLVRLALVASLTFRLRRRASSEPRAQGVALRFGELRDVGSRRRRHLQRRVGLDDLVLRARHRTLVHEQWAMKREGWRGDGATALFAGPSGTGKTRAAA